MQPDERHWWEGKNLFSAEHYRPLVQPPGALTRWEVYDRILVNLRAYAEDTRMLVEIRSLLPDLAIRLSAQLFEEQ